MGKYILKHSFVSEIKLEKLNWLIELSVIVYKNATVHSSRTFNKNSYPTSIYTIVR